jgi:hypothetical protein
MYSGKGISMSLVDLTDARPEENAGFFRLKAESSCWAFGAVPASRESHDDPPLAFAMI